MGGKLDVVAMSAANSYTDMSVEGYGVQAGKNCQIASIENITGGKRLNFAWYDDEQVRKSATLDVMNGVDGKDGKNGTDGKDGKDGIDGKDGSQVSVNPIQATGTKVGEITVDGTKYTLYAPAGGGGGGDAVLTDDLTTAISVGGIDSGVTYEAGTPLETLLRDLLEPTLYPSFTAPSASLSYGASTYYAVGATVSAMNATVALNRGAITPAYGTSGYRSGAATGFAISTSGADTEYTGSSTESGTFNVSALTRSTKGTIVLTGTASYAAGEQPKDSKGNNYSSPLAAGSVTATKTLNFILPYYYGASNSSSVSDFTGLTQSVTAKGQKTFNYTTSNQYMVFAYDKTYGNLKSITDGNGFDVTDGWTKSTVTVNGFEYYVYVAKSATTDTNAPFTFKY